MFINQTDSKGQMLRGIFMGEEIKICTKRLGGFFGTNLDIIKLTCKCDF